MDAGVPGNVSDGDPPRSNEWECDNDGVCSQLLLARALKILKLSNPRFAMEKQKTKIFLKRIKGVSKKTYMRIGVMISIANIYARQWRVTHPVLAKHSFILEWIFAFHWAQLIR